MRSRKLSLLAIAAVAVFAFSGGAPVFAQRGGGGGGSHGGGAFHGGGGGFHGGGAFHGSAGGFHGARGFRGGAYGGWHNSRGYGYGWGGGYYGGAGWLGYGLLFSTLPLAYATYYWDGVPYYYADDNYYQWNSAADEYETVQPPAAVVNAASAAAPVDSAQTELYAYPKNGQSAALQATDRTECQQWATAQTGAEPARHASYLKAEEACLTGKGYSVR